MPMNPPKSAMGDLFFAKWLANVRKSRMINSLDVDALRFHIGQKAMLAQFSPLSARLCPAKRGV